MQSFKLHPQYILIHLGHLLDRLHSSWQGLQLYEEVFGLPDTDGFFLESKHTHRHMHAAYHRCMNVYPRECMCVPEVECPKVSFVKVTQINTVL